MELLVAETFPERKQKDGGATPLLSYSSVTLRCELRLASWIMKAAVVEVRLSGLLVSISLTSVDFMRVFQPVIRLK